MNNKFNEFRYYRMIKALEPGFFFKKADAEFEVMVAPGKIEHVVGFRELELKLGGEEKDYRGGYQEGRRVAKSLFRRGNDHWVSFPFIGSFPTSYLLSDE